jgi:hypothetical protein
MRSQHSSLQMTRLVISTLSSTLLICFKSINVIECPQLRAIFLMLRQELKDSDIPHRSTVRARILELWDEHLDGLETEMAVCYNYDLPIFAGEVNQL